MLNTVIDKIAYRIPQSISELSLGKYLQLQYPQLTEIEQVGIVLDGKRNAFTALPYTSQLEQSISNTMRLLGDVLESINDFRIHAAHRITRQRYPARPAYTRTAGHWPRALRCKDAG
jgi:hypothetical protein